MTFRPLSDEFHKAKEGSSYLFFFAEALKKGSDNRLLRMEDMDKYDTVKKMISR
ncbi:MAG: hypothetical protein RDV48_24165 [Candidatus Eremiobacteraeota bacterium]|nr:hypothetical protein [Candidatus Eremiobacteraeota bacterium]